MDSKSETVLQEIRRLLPPRYKLNHSEDICYTFEKSFVIKGTNKKTNERILIKFFPTAKEGQMNNELELLILLQGNRHFSQIE